MKKMLLWAGCVVVSMFFCSQIAWASQNANSPNLTIEGIQPVMQSGSFGWIRIQSGIIEASKIDLDTIKVIDISQDENAAFVYCNFTHKQGKKYFGYIPLLRIKNSRTWINRDNGLILQ